MDSRDYNKSFEKLLGKLFPVYKREGLEVVPDGYLLHGRFYSTLKEVDQAICGNCLTISHSINRDKIENPSK